MKKLLFLIIISSLWTTADLNAETFKSNDIERVQKNLLIASSCGGGGHGANTILKKKEKEIKQAKVKLMAKKRIRAKKASLGQSTSKLDSEIKALEALLSK